MRIGITTGTGHLDPDTLRATLAAADTLGYHSVWARPEDAGGSTLDPLAVVGYAAGATRGVNIGTGAIAAWRHQPLVLARMLTTLHHLSGNRLVVGLEIGDGVQRTFTLAVLDALDALDRSPDPHRRPPVLLATRRDTEDRGPADDRGRADDRGSADDRGLVAERADGWLADASSPEELGARWSAVLGRAAAIGRDPRRMRLVVPVHVPCGDDDLHGVIERMRHLERLGVHEAVLAAGAADSLDEMLARYARLAEVFLPDGPERQAVSTG